MGGTFCASPRVTVYVGSTLIRFNFENNGMLRPSVNVNGFFKDVPTPVREDGLCKIRLSDVSKEVTGRLCRGTGVDVAKFRGAACPSGFFSIIIKGIPFNSCGMFSPGCGGCGFHVRSCFLTGTLSRMEPKNVITMVAAGKALSGTGPAVQGCLTRETRLIKTMELPGATFGSGTKARIATSVLFLRGEREGVSVRPS